MKKGVWIERKGQVTIFLIIAVVVVIAFGLVLFFNSTGQDITQNIITQTAVSADPGSIQTFVETCMYQETEPLLYLIAEQGGTLNPPSSEQLFYEDAAYTYSCMWQPTKGCVNKLYTRASMQNELKTILERDESIKQCASLEQFRNQGFSVDTGELSVEVAIGQDDVHVEMFYPILLEQAETEISVSEYAVNVLVPLGKMIDLSQHIQFEEHERNYFDEDAWMVAHGEEVRIHKHKPYPDLVYSLVSPVEDHDDLVYNFAMQGESTVDLIGLPTLVPDHGGYCIYDDFTCYANPEDGNCRGGRYEPVVAPSVESCQGITEWSGTDCSGELCRPCTREDTGELMQHGESWCEYDKAVSPGFDHVGSRHYQRSCINGEVKQTECRDYREELCAERTIVDSATGDAMHQGVCRPNRWQNCSIQSSQESCSEAGDCYWTEGLIKSNGMEKECDYKWDSWDWTDERLYADDPNRPYETRKCHPRTPPGFKFWKQQGIEICAMANEMVDADLESHAQSWVDSSANYCLSLGDCGAWRNVADELDEKGFLNSDAVNENKISDGIFYYKESFKTIYQDDKRNVVQNAPINDETFAPYIATGDEFVDAQSNIQNMLSQWLQYMDCANKEFTEGNIKSELKKEFCSKRCGITNVCCADVHHHHWLRHVSFCMPWQAPTPGEHSRLAFRPLQREDPQVMCAYCEEDVVNGKPCTEYKCKSLGTNCLFEVDERGYGTCFEASSGDTIAPQLEIDVSSLDGIEIEQAFLTRGTYRGERLCNGPCDGDDPSFPPFSEVAFTLDSINEESQCKVSLFPIQDYYATDPFISHLFLNRIPVTQTTDFGLFLGGDFASEHEIQFTVFPMHEVYGELSGFFDTQLLYQIADFNVLSNWLWRITTIGARVLGRGDQTELALEFLELWKTFQDAQTELRQIFDDFDDAIHIVLSESLGQNVVLFFNCIDTAGNQNENFFVKFRVGEDNRPPEIVETIPEQGEPVQEAFRLQVFLNEPSECRFVLDDSTSTYEQMPVENQMECQTSYFDTSGGNYKCIADVAQFEPSFRTAEVFISCIDHPIRFESYHIQIDAGTEFFLNTDSFDEVSLEDPNRIVIDEISELSFETPQVVINASRDTTAIIEFTLEEDHDCRYDTADQITFEATPIAQQIPCVASGDAYRCSGALPVDGSTVYTINCAHRNQHHQNQFPTSKRYSFPIVR